MTAHLSIPWPDAAPFAGRSGRPIRILAVSDELDPALEHETNRERLEPIDLVVGCGDLQADQLCFVADAFRAPLVYVRGNHDSGGRWSRGAVRLPVPLRGGSRTEAGLRIVGLGWPGLETSRGHALRDGAAAWRDVLGLALHIMFRPPFRERGRRMLVVSHAAPLGLGDGPDAYHRGFAAYRWLLARLRPPLWLHGHTTLASTSGRRVDADGTAIVNVTGAVLVELLPPGGRG